MNRIVMVSPYRDLGQQALRVAHELGIVIEVYDGNLEEACGIVERLSGPKPDVLISRAGTAACLSAAFDLPVVTMDTGPFDLMECCSEARAVAPNIAVTAFGRAPLGIALLERTMGVAITPLVFHSLPDLRDKIYELAKNGLFCVVGGGPSVTFAREAGLPGVLLRTSLETVRDALLRANEIAKLRQAETRKANRLQTILDSIYDGVIAVDEHGKLEIFNRAAAKILSIPTDNVLGRPVVDIVANSRLDEVLKSGVHEIGAVQQVGDASIVTNRVPVLEDEEIIGAVATFQDMTKVFQTEARLRKTLVGREFRAKFTLDDIVGQTPVICETRSLARSFARSDLTVLLYGASGTGKELFAQGIHRASRRKHKPFVAVNCGALPPHLLESELFGYEEGAFTGAKRKGKHGLFELAHEGTIFLDEVDSLPLELQARLLRVLQEREVLRIGSESLIPVDIRVIAATNTEPMALLAQKRMRSDLFYRLNVLYLELPPLKERRDDIPLLCRHFQRDSAEVGRLVTEMMPFFLRYSWPGNVRELFNMMERLSLYQGENCLAPGVDAPGVLRKLAPQLLAELAARPAAEEGLTAQLADREAQVILQAVRTAGSVSAAAAQLGIGRSTLWRKLKKMGLSLPRE